jgi:hypothetical protein
MSRAASRFARSAKPSSSRRSDLARSAGRAWGLRRRRPPGMPSIRPITVRVMRCSRNIVSPTNERRSGLSFATEAGHVQHYRALQENCYASPGFHGRSSVVSYRPRLRAEGGILFGLFSWITRQWCRSRARPPARRWRLSRRHRRRDSSSPSTWPNACRRRTIACRCRWSRDASRRACGRRAFP